MKPDQWKIITYIYINFAINIFNVIRIMNTDTADTFRLSPKQVETRLNYVLPYPQDSSAPL